MIKLSRREFLGLVGTASLFALFGCNNEKSREETKPMISATALQKYELLTCQDGNMLVKYKPEAKTFTATQLKIINNSLEEVDIFQSDVIEPNDGLNLFYNEFDVLDSIPAEQAFINQYGTKHYYTIEEVSGIINQKSYQKTK